jgi:hypothetical protein
VIERFTKINDGKLSIYYTLSTWNPYTVVKMESDFTITRAGNPVGDDDVGELASSRRLQAQNFNGMNGWSSTSPRWPWRLRWANSGVVVKTDVTAPARRDFAPGIE